MGRVVAVGGSWRRPARHVLHRVSQSGPKGPFRAANDLMEFGQMAGSIAAFRRVGRGCPMRFSRIALLLGLILLGTSGCAIAHPHGVVAQLGGSRLQMGITGFPVGRSVVIERKADLGNPLTLVPEIWTSVCAISIPAGGYYVVTLQIRMPHGAWAEGRMVRVGWGKDADGRDETGYHTFLARPDGRATSESFTHALAGGGPLAFEVRLHPRRTKHQVGPLGPVQLHTVVCKAHRTD
jgi:hypothetical protein